MFWIFLKCLNKMPIKVGISSFKTCKVILNIFSKDASWLIWNLEGILYPWRSFLIRRRDLCLFLKSEKMLYLKGNPLLDGGVTLNYEKKLKNCFYPRYPLGIPIPFSWILGRFHMAKWKESHMNIFLFEHLPFEKIIPYKVTFKVSRKFLKCEKCVALLSIFFKGIFVHS